MLKLTNDRTEFIVTASNQKITSVRLFDKQTGITWADQLWDLRVVVKFGNKVNCLTGSDCTFSVTGYDGKSLLIEVNHKPLEHSDLSYCIQYKIELSNDSDRFEESIIIRNTGSTTFRLTEFTLQWKCSHLQKDLNFLSVPFTSHEQKPDLILLNEREELNSMCEGVLLLGSRHGLTIARTPSDIEPQWIGINKKKEELNFGGIAKGIPADLDGRNLLPGEAFDFGTSNYMFFTGKTEDGLARYRHFMAEHGVTMPKNYNPPINYCIFYECREFWQHRNLLDTLDYARELGCTLLYTDQGWEDYSGSGIWDEMRLGNLNTFIAAAQKKGLDVGVLVKMHGHAYIWPQHVYRRDAEGNIVYGDLHGAGDLVGVCPTVPEWHKAKVERLAKMAKAGVKFFSFDFNDFQKATACCDPTHKHSRPIRAWEHALGVAKNQEATKAICPNVLIEAHDWVSAGEYILPIYLFNSGHHERWGFEYMWKPYEDFKAGRLHNLYYYNMAYEMPLYLHMDLSSDNENGVVFWYVASTVRHFGVGNYAKLDNDRKKLCRDMMSIYKQYQKFFSHGIFWGDGPNAHFHILHGQGAIALIFNDSEQEREITAELCPALMTDKNQEICIKPLFGAEAVVRKSNNKINIVQKMKGYSVSVMKIDMAFISAQKTEKTTDIKPQSVLFTR